MDARTILRCLELFCEVWQPFRRSEDSHYDESMVNNRQQLCRVRTHLRHSVRWLLEKYDLGSIAHGCFRSDESNCLFDVRTAKGKQYILRISTARRCHESDETLAEVSWITALADETDLDLRMPVRMVDGESMGEVECEFIPQYRQFVLFERVLGETLGDRIGLMTATNLGVAVAKLHLQAIGFKPDRGRVRQLDTVFPYANEYFTDHEPVEVLNEEFEILYSRGVCDIYRQAVLRAEEATKALFEERSGLRLIHNDLHARNVVTRAQRITIIDFEDLMWGFPIQDIATTFYHFQDHPRARVLERAFQDGYETVAEWPVDSTRQLNALIVGRGLRLANAVLASPDRAVYARKTAYISGVAARIAKLLKLRVDPHLVGLI